MARGISNLKRGRGRPAKKKVEETQDPIEPAKDAFEGDPNKAGPRMAFTGKIEVPVKPADEESVKMAGAAQANVPVYKDNIETIDAGVNTLTKSYRKKVGDLDPDTGGMVDNAVNPDTIDGKPPIPLPNGAVDLDTVNDPVNLGDASVCPIVYKQTDPSTTRTIDYILRVFIQNTIQSGNNGRVEVHIEGLGFIHSKRSDQNPPTETFLLELIREFHAKARQR